MSCMSSLPPPIATCFQVRGCSRALPRAHTCTKTRARACRENLEIHSRRAVVHPALNHSGPKRAEARPEMENLDVPRLVVGFLQRSDPALLGSLGSLDAWVWWPIREINRPCSVGCGSYGKFRSSAGLDAQTAPIMGSCLCALSLRNALFSAVGRDEMHSACIWERVPALLRASELSAMACRVVACHGVEMAIIA